MVDSAAVPQLTEFPTLAEGEYRAAVGAFARVLREYPAEGLPFKEFRARLKKAKMWSRERLPVLLRFLRVPHSDPIVPSAWMRRVAHAAGEDAALDLLLGRLQEANPLLLREVILRIKEQVHSPNEVLKFLHSFAYPGSRLAAAEIRAWLAFAQGLEVFKPVGIRLGLGPRGEALLEWATAFDVEEFLEEDAPEPEPEPASPPPAAPDDAQPPEPEAPPEPPAATKSPDLPPPDSSRLRPSPLGLGPVIPTSRFATNGVFPDELRAITTDRVSRWWASLDARHEAGSPADFGVDGEAWGLDAEEALFRLAVAAALSFRHADAAGALAELDRSGALSALHAGTLDEVPAVRDARALMLASLVARRLAEHPNAAADLEKQPTAEAVFDHLDATLGRGLFGMELYWLVRMLSGLGVLRVEGLAAFSALPTRAARDALYRLGFLDSPYAPDVASLRAAAAAASEAAPTPADAVLQAFTIAAGCAYGCRHRRTCDLPCRERADS